MNIVEIHINNSVKRISVVVEIDGEIKKTLMKEVSKKWK